MNCNDKAGSTVWLSDSADTRWQCTVCGRMGSVGRCCGDETRKPLNEAARQEYERIEAANAEVSDGGPLTHDKPAAQSRRSLH